MKKIIILFLVLMATVAFAGDREELGLKRDLLRERVTRLNFEFQVLQSRIAEIPKEFQAAQKDLADTEKKIADLPKEDKK